MYSLIFIYRIIILWKSKIKIQIFMAVFTGLEFWRRTSDRHYSFSTVDNRFINDFIALQALSAN